MWIPIHFYRRYNFTHPEASFLVCVPYIVMIFTAPIFGKVIDKIGQNNLVTTIGCGFIIIAHLTLFCMFGEKYNEEKQPYYPAIIPLILIGMSLTIFNIVSNAANLALLVDRKALGTAFGLNYAVQNLGLSYQPAITALIYDKLTDGKEYHMAELMFLIIAICSLIANTMLWIYDYKY